MAVVTRALAAPQYVSDREKGPLRRTEGPPSAASIGGTVRSDRSRMEDNMMGKVGGKIALSCVLAVAVLLGCQTQRRATPTPLPELGSIDPMSSGFSPNGDKTKDTIDLSLFFGDAAKVKGGTSRSRTVTRAFRRPSRPTAARCQATWSGMARRRPARWRPRGCTPRSYQSTMAPRSRPTLPRAGSSF